VPEVEVFIAAEERLLFYGAAELLDAQLAGLGQRLPAEGLITPRWFFLRIALRHGKYDRRDRGCRLSVQQLKN